MPAFSKAVSVAPVPARRWHWPSIATLVVSVLINLCWIAFFVWAVCISIDLWMDHTGKLAQMLWKGLRIGPV